MARRGDRVMDELKAIRRRLSARLRRAFDEGRLEKEVAILDREGKRAYRAIPNGSRNGKPRAK